MTILRGTFIGEYCVLKQSGQGYELSDGKKVIRVAAADVEKGKFDDSELMFNLPQPKKKTPKKTATKKKK